MSTSSRRARRRHERALKTGQAPGTAVYTGRVRDTPVAVKVIDFDADGVRTFDNLCEDACRRAHMTTSVTWVDADGIHDAERVKAVTEPFGVHPLWIEDLLNPTCRPKSEVLGDQLLFVVKMVQLIPGPDATLEMEIEQVGLVCGPGWVLTFQETPGDVWDPVRARIGTGARLRKLGETYLLHALLDAVVDEYFVVLEHFEKEVDRVEDSSLLNTVADLPPRLYALRRELASFRAVIWPVREAVGQLLRGDFESISPEEVPFYRDLYDHCVQSMDIADAIRDRLLGVVELQLAIVNNQTNVVMRWLTVVSTVFIPLTFVVGVYGMNFEVMPELQWRYGYLGVWLVMIAVAVGLLAHFRRRGWL